MDETLTMSEAINEIALALSKFQSTVKQPKLSKTVKVTTKTGGSYNFKYADLAECMSAAQKPLGENGLAVTQIVVAGQLRTVLIHKSGQWIASSILLGQSSDIQAYGSQLTYLKRYSYCAILGLVADNDDDGNVACGNKYQQQDLARAPQPVQSAQDVSLNEEYQHYALPEIEQAIDKESLLNVWNNHPDLQNYTPFMNAMSARRKALNIKKS